MCVCIYVYVCVCTLCVCMYVCMYAYVCVCTRVCMCVLMAEEAYSILYQRKLNGWSNKSIHILKYCQTERNRLRNVTHFRQKVDVETSKT
jgi:hypothetical protein